MPSIVSFEVAIVETVPHSSWADVVRGRLSPAVMIASRQLITGRWSIFCAWGDTTEEGLGSPDCGGQAVQQHIKTGFGLHAGQLADLGCQAAARIFDLGLGSLVGSWEDKRPDST